MRRRDQIKESVKRQKKMREELLKRLREPATPEETKTRKIDKK